MSRYTTGGRVLGIGLVAFFVLVVGLVAIYPEKGSLWFSFRPSSSVDSHEGLEDKLVAAEAKLDAQAVAIGNLITTLTVIEFALESLDDKVTTLAVGHSRLQKNQGALAAKLDDH